MNKLFICVLIVCTVIVSYKACDYFNNKNELVILEKEKANLSISLLKKLMKKNKFQSREIFNIIY